MAADASLRLFVSIASVPPRLHFVDRTVSSLMKQTRPPERVLLVLPIHFARWPGATVNLSLVAPHPALEVVRCEDDWGPGTKLLCALPRVMDLLGMRPASKTLGGARYRAAVALSGAYLVLADDDREYRSRSLALLEAAIMRATQATPPSAAPSPPSSWLPSARSLVHRRHDHGNGERGPTPLDDTNATTASPTVTGTYPPTTTRAASAAAVAVPRPQPAFSFLVYDLPESQLPMQPPVLTAAYAGPSLDSIRAGGTARHGPRYSSNHSNNAGSSHGSSSGGSGGGGGGRGTGLAAAPDEQRRVPGSLLAVGQGADLFALPVGVMARFITWPFNRSGLLEFYRGAMRVDARFRYHDDVWISMFLTDVVGAAVCPVNYIDERNLTRRAPPPHLGKVRFRSVYAHQPLRHLLRIQCFRLSDCVRIACADCAMSRHLAFRFWSDAQVHGPKETWSTALRRLPIGNLTRKQLNRFLGAKRGEVLQEALRSHVAPRVASVRNRSRAGGGGFDGAPPLLHRQHAHQLPLPMSTCEPEGTPMAHEPVE